MGQQYQGHKKIHCSVDFKKIKFVVYLNIIIMGQQYQGHKKIHCSVDFKKIKFVVYNNWIYIRPAGG